MSDPVWLVASLLSWKPAIQVHIEKWPHSGPLVSTEWIGAGVHIDHARQPILALLKHLRDLVRYPNTLWGIPTNTSDYADPRHIWARPAKTPTNDSKLIPAG
jgi:hypothetical protein|tara:strand:- start:181 stop:486 length:306 start_codon:yes stop_codon:yes gene_type:complete